jgi:hypothetical protein
MLDIVSSFRLAEESRRRIGSRSMVTRNAAQKRFH